MEASQTTAGLTWEPVLSTGWAILLFLFLSGLFIWSYSKTTKPVKPGLRATLIGLRLIALLMVFLALMRPIWETVTSLTEQAYLIVLQDNSESMTFQDCPGDKKRYEEVNEFWKNNAKAFEEMGGVVTDKPGEDKGLFKVFNKKFGKTYPLEKETDIPSESNTYIGGVLRKAYNELTAQNRKIAAALLITDGQDTSGNSIIDAVYEYRNAHIPIYVYMPGDTKPSSKDKDIAVDDVKSSKRVSKGSKASVKAIIRVLGYAGSSVDFIMKDNDQAIPGMKAETIKIPEGDNDFRTEIAFEYTGAEEGPHTISISTPPRQGEETDKNNFNTTSIMVDAESLGALYIDGALYQEGKFLRRTIQESTNMELTTKYALQTDKAEKNIPPPEELKKYKIYILGDVKRAAFTDEQLKCIYEEVTKKGKGLIVVGGVGNYGLGGWAKSPLADLLPFEISQDDKLVEETFKFKVTNSGYEHFAMNIGKDLDENKKLWEKMDKLSGYVKCGKLKPTGIALARGPNDDVIMATTKAGAGRVLAFTSGTTWKWYLSGEDTINEYKRFWRQCLLWVSSQDDINTAEFSISSEFYKYDLGKSVKIIAVLNSGKGSPIQNADITAQIIQTRDKDSNKLAENKVVQKVKLNYDSQTERYYIMFTPSEGGTYYIEGKAELNAKELGKGKSPDFKIQVVNLEKEKRTANLEILKQIAQETNGMVYTSNDDRSKIFEEIKKNRQQDKLEVRSPETLWDKYYVFLIFIGALTTEWLLRKRGGLV